MSPSHLRSTFYFTLKYRGRCVHLSPLPPAIWSGLLIPSNMTLCLVARQGSNLARLTACILYSALTSQGAYKGSGSKYLEIYLHVQKMRIFLHWFQVMNETHDGEAETECFSAPPRVHRPQSGIRWEWGGAGAGAGWCSYSGPGSALPSTGYIYTVITWPSPARPTCTCIPPLPGYWAGAGAGAARGKLLETFMGIIKYAA